MKRAVRKTARKTSIKRRRLPKQAKKASIAEITIAAADGPAALQAAADLGIAVPTTEVRGAGGGALLSLAIGVFHDPLARGLFLGFLVSRGSRIEYRKKDGLVITITNLKALWRVLGAMIEE